MSVRGKPLPGHGIAPIVVTAILFAACVAIGATTVLWMRHAQHHGVDEICKAFPAPNYPRPLSYTVRLPDGQPLATGACQ